MMANPFTKIIETLHLTSTIQQEVQIARQLAFAYDELLTNAMPDARFKNIEPTTIDGGVALSSQHALDCLQDPLRTVRFLKGIYEAIQDCFQLFPSQKINVLYAGSGPGAPLMLPLLSQFDPSQLSVTVIDINETSISSLRSIIEFLGLESYVRDLIKADATSFQFPNNIPLHILVSETMDKALTKEPQVAITQNLAPQIVEKGLLIPSEIKLFGEHTFYSKEPYFDNDKDVLNPGNTLKTKDKKELFSITKDIDATPSFIFRSDAIATPKNFKETPDISIYAEIHIYRKQVLHKSESQISNPYCVASLYNLNEEHYVIQYDSSGIPDWSVRS